LENSKYKKFPLNIFSVEEMAGPSLQSKLSAKKIVAAKAKGDLFGMLLLDDSATHDATRRAYKSLAKLLHPDKVGAKDEECREAFEAVHEAYSKLSDAAAFAATVAESREAAQRASRLASEREALDVFCGKASSRYCGGGGTSRQQQPWKTPTWTPPTSEWWRTSRADFSSMPSSHQQQFRPSSSSSPSSDPFSLDFQTGPKKTYADLFGKDHPKTKAREAREAAERKAREEAKMFGTRIPRKRSAPAYAERPTPSSSRRRRTTTTTPKKQKFF
jgi:curved DNA-binding protein CbpA